MMTSDNKWGGAPMRSHDLGVLPWNEANKIPSLSHYLQVRASAPPPLPRT